MESILLTLLIVVLIVGLLLWLVGQLPIPHPFNVVAQVIIVVIALIYLMRFLP